MNAKSKSQYLVMNTFLCILSFMCITTGVCNYAMQRGRCLRLSCPINVPSLTRIAAFMVVGYIAFAAMSSHSASENDVDFPFWEI